jgi:predicted NBD/HSP70 family sugar kinase
MAMTGNQAYQKAINQALVMRAIRDAPGISRTEIAATTGLTKSTVGNLARQLRSRGLIRESNPEGSGGTGRPRVGLLLADSAATVVGVELRRDEISIVTMGLAGTILERHSSRDYDTPNSFDTLHEAWEAAGDLLRRHPLHRCVGIGVAVPASTDPIRGTVLESEDFDVQGFNLESLTVIDAVVPVLLENDANAVAWGAVGREHVISAAPTGELLVVTGRIDSRSGALRIGTAIVLENRVFYGKDFGAGEFRSARWRRGMKGELAEGSGAERDALIELCENLSVPVSMLRPQRIVVAGDLVDRLPQIQDILASELAGAYIDPRVSGVSFVPADEAEYAVASGAAYMFLEHLFEVPGIDRSRPQGVPEWHELREG